MAINAGYGDSGFFFNESGLQWEEYPGTFGGWLGGFFLLLSFPLLSFLPFAHHHDIYRYPILPLSIPLYRPTPFLPSFQTFPSRCSFFFSFVPEAGENRKKAKALIEKKNPFHSLRLVPRHPPALLDKGVLSPQIPRQLLRGEFAACRGYGVR